MWDCSPEKLNLLFELAVARRQREQGVESVWMMRSVQAAVASLMSKEGQSFFAEELKRVMEIAFGEQKEKKEEDPKQRRKKNMRKIAAHFTQSGVRKHGIR